MNSRAELHAYWENPGPENSPKKYLGKGRSSRSQFLVQLLASIRLPNGSIGVDRQDAILEIGCNSGRNLMHLWKAGYRNLHGIEINPAAVELMRSKLPYLRAQVQVGPVEEILPRLEPVDVIFSLAVLVHLHPDSEFIFAEMVEKANKFLITIEDEHSNKSRHCARNYEQVFESLGMRQIYFEPSVPGMNPAYCARAFEVKR
jgi:SAM-dependent methyltransferase